MKKKKMRILLILFCLILQGLVLMHPGPPSLALPADSQASSASSSGKVKKLEPDDLALYISENGTADIHVQNANTGYLYALLGSNGNTLGGWKEPEDGRVIFEDQKTDQKYSVVFKPDYWSGDPEDWSKTAIHFDLPDYDDAIDKTFVNPQDVERSKDGTIIWIYSTHKDCEYALYDFYTDQPATEWKDGVAGVVVFTNLKPYRDYNVRARIKGTGPKPEIIPDKPLPMPGADVIVGECSFDDLSGYGLIHVWATPGYGYAILDQNNKPMSLEDMLKWDIFVKDQYELEVDRGDDGYYRGKEGGRITFSVPAGGTYKMGGVHPDGETFVSDQKFQVKSVNKNYWFEYVIPKGSADGFYRLVIYPACPYSIYKLSAIHSFIHFIDRYGRVQPGGDNRLIFSPVNGFLEYVITAQPIPLTLTESPEDELFGNDLWESDAWGSGISAGDVSGGDVSGGDVSTGDVFVKLPLVPPEQFDELTGQDVRRSKDGKEITVQGSDKQQYALADPITNMLLGPWHDSEKGEVEFHSLDPKTPYLILTQLPETENHTCVFQPDGVYVPGIDSGGDVSGGDVDVSGGDVSGGDVSGGDSGNGNAGGGSSSGDRQAVHVTLEMFQSINGGISSNRDQSVQSGDTVLYSIIAENHGNRKVSNAVITDSVPEGMTLKEESISGNGVYDPKTRTITWNIDLGSADSWDDFNSNSVSLQFQATVDRPHKKTSYDNMAYIERKGASIDSSNMVHASTSTMTIAKKTDGVYKDPKAIFLFTLHLVPPQGGEIDTDKIVCSDGKTTFVKSKKEGDYVARFALLDGQQVKFIGLPPGATYQMEENSANLGKYRTTVTDFTGSILMDDEGGQRSGTGTIPSDGTDTAVFFLNTRRER